MELRSIPVATGAGPEARFSSAFLFLGEQVVGDGGDDDEALDGLDPGGVHAHDGQALVEHAMIRAPTMAPGMVPMPPVTAVPPDEAGRDGVHLELMPGLSR